MTQGTKQLAISSQKLKAQLIKLQWIIIGARLIQKDVNPIMDHYALG